LIAPVINANAFDVVVHKVSFVSAIVCPREAALTVLLTVYVLT
jgi:hypothetical protein